MINKFDDFHKINENINIFEEFENIMKEKDLSKQDFINYLIDNDFFSADSILDYLYDVIEGDQDWYVDKLGKIK